MSSFPTIAQPSTVVGNSNISIISIDNKGMYVRSLFLNIDDDDDDFLFILDLLFDNIMV